MTVNSFCTRAYDREGLSIENGCGHRLLSEVGDIIMTSEWGLMMSIGTARDL